MSIESYNQWVQVDGDHTHLLNYSLTNESVVYEIGGNLGVWVGNLLEKHPSVKPHVRVYEPIWEFCCALRERFRANRNVYIVCAGLSDRTGHKLMSVQGDVSSMHKEAQTQVFCHDIVNEVQDFAAIDLVSMNCEGHEYILLPHLIESGQMGRIKNIQIQFHEPPFLAAFPDARERRERIQEGLQKTHVKTFDYPFVWEGWTQK